MNSYTSHTAATILSGRVTPQLGPKVNVQNEKENGEGQNLHGCWKLYKICKKKALFALQYVQKVWEVMKCIKILAKFAQFRWAYFISSLFTASTYNMKGYSFCLICLDFKVSAAYQNNLICPL